MGSFPEYSTGVGAVVDGEVGAADVGGGVVAAGDGCASGAQAASILNMIRADKKREINLTLLFPDINCITSFKNFLTYSKSVNG